VLFRLGPIIGLFVVATLIVFAIEPLIKKIMKGTLLNHKISRGVAVAISYSALILVLVLIITIWLPPFISESQKLFKNLPKIVKSIDLGAQVDLNLAQFLPQASQVSGNLLTAIMSIFSNITGIVSIFIVSIYLSLDWPNMKRRFASLFPSKAEDLVYDTLDEIEISLGHWVKGEAVLMFVVGLFSFVGLVLLDIDYPLALGLISGFLEVVPMMGPIISAVFASVIALADAPIKAVGVIILFIVIQQLENNILVPKVMQKVSGFSPLIILLSLLIGSEFFGIAGAILAVPSIMTIGIVARRVIKFLR